MEPIPVTGILAVFQQIMECKETGAAMVEHAVQNHADSFFMTVVHLFAEFFLRAKTEINFKVVHRVILMPTVGCEDWCHVDAGNTKFLQILEILTDAPERRAMLGFIHLPIDTTLDWKLSANPLIIAFDLSGLKQRQWADLNQMNSTVDTYLKDSIDLWLDLGVDGIRVDAVKHMPMGWQSNWLPAIYEEHETYTTSTAYQVISKLAALRKTNAAVAYGITQGRWMNSDVLVYERTFGNSVVLVAVNRSSTQGYDIGGAYMALPDGQHADVLCNLLGGGTLTVTDGEIGSYYLQAGQAAVWQYSTTDTAPVIGNIDPMVGILGNIVTITGTGFGGSTGTVRFGTNAAQVVSWSDSLIQVQVPAVTAGYYEISVTTRSGATTSNYDEFKVLTGS